MRPRITVVGTVYHQSPGQDPTSVQTRHGRTLTSDEQPYRRRITVGGKWVPLDHGWVQEASLLIVENEATRRPVNPTPEEAAEDAARVVDIGTTAGIPDEAAFPVAEVHPGEDCRFTPSDLDTLMIRCRKGTARVVVTVFPR